MKSHHIGLRLLLWIAPAWAWPFTDSAGDGLLAAAQGLMPRDIPELPVFNSPLATRDAISPQRIQRRAPVTPPPAAPAPAPAPASAHGPSGPAVPKGPVAGPGGKQGPAPGPPGPVQPSSKTGLAPNQIPQDPALAKGPIFSQKQGLTANQVCAPPAFPRTKGFTALYGKQQAMLTEFQAVQGAWLRKPSSLSLAVALRSNNTAYHYNPTAVKGLKMKGREPSCGFSHMSSPHNINRLNILYENAQWYVINNGPSYNMNHFSVANQNHAGQSFMHLLIIPKVWIINAVSLEGPQVTKSARAAFAAFLQQPNWLDKITARNLENTKYTLGVNNLPSCEIKNQQRLKMFARANVHSIRDWTFVVHLIDDISVPYLHIHVFPTDPTGTLRAYSSSMHDGHDKLLSVVEGSLATHPMWVVDPRYTHSIAHYIGSADPHMKNPAPTIRPPPLLAKHAPGARIASGQHQMAASHQPAAPAPAPAPANPAPAAAPASKAAPAAAPASNSGGAMAPPQANVRFLGVQHLG